MNYRSVVAGVVLLLFAIGPWHVARATADEFGAIAFSQTTGAHGFSHNYASRAEAERRALSGCRRHGSGCRVVVYFYNTCAALAVGSGNGYGYAWAAQRGQAERAALGQCGSRAQSCRVVRWVCSR